MNVPTESGLRSNDGRGAGGLARVGVALRRHPVRTGVGVALFAGLVAFVFVFFAPQDLFIDTSVNQPVPVATLTTASASSVAPRVIPPAVLGKGPFRSGEHHTTGVASLLRLADGRRFVRLDGLETSNGPDVRIWLSAASATASDGEIGRAAHVDLGGLQANHGNQNYAVPASADPSGYRSVIIWCRRFHVVFGAASLR